MQSKTDLSTITDWISTAEAAKLKRSPTADRTTTHCIVRMIVKGKLIAKREAGFWFVSRASLLAYLEHGGRRPKLPSPKFATARSRRASMRASLRNLKRFGIVPKWAEGMI